MSFSCCKTIPSTLSAATCNFIPVIGETYHLYQREDGTDFLSLIEPNSWKQVHMGSFRFETSRKWIKL